MPNVITDITQTNLQLPNSKIFQIDIENFIYTGGTTSFTVTNLIKGVISVNINGLDNNTSVGFFTINKNTVTFNDTLDIPSTVSIKYSF